MQIITPQSSTIIFGFDSAWTDSPKAPGAICAIAFDENGNADFKMPCLVSFAQAIDFIEAKRHSYAFSLVALDQPTVVPNMTGIRPVERVAASLVSFVGGGVQPANRGKRGMFCDDSPIWQFLSALGATEAPEESRSAITGHYLVEVFPALALPGLHPPFAKRLGAPKYNPKNRRKFRIEDWQEVTRIVAALANELGIAGLATWADTMTSLSTPKKAHQDMLDASICALVGLIWRGGPREASVMIGDIDKGYMVTPTSDAARQKLEAAALARDVPFC